MTKDEDKQRSNVNPSAFNITNKLFCKSKVREVLILLSCEENQNCGKEVEKSNDS